MQRVRRRRLRSAEPIARRRAPMTHAEGSMKGIVQRVPIVVLLVTLIVAGPLAALSSCSQFITTGENDSPNSGSLVGEKTVTTSTTTRYTGSGTFMVVGGMYEGATT